MRLLRETILTILTIAAAPAQTKFEVASIRATPPGNPEQGKAGLRIDGSQVRYSGLTLRDYIGIAYKVKLYQISGPDWITSEKFEIGAKIPDGVSASQVPAMLQSLLEERFHLQSHLEKRDYPVYALIPGKGGSKLTESATDPATERTGAAAMDASGSRDGVSLSLPNGAFFNFSSSALECRNLSMPLFADTLGRFLDRPVVDLSGLNKTYDFKIPVTADDFNAMNIRAALSAGVSLPPQALRLLDSGSNDSLFTGMEKLGLKFDARKAPLDFLVVDHMEKAPSEN